MLRANIPFLAGHNIQSWQIFRKVCVGGDLRPVIYKLSLQSCTFFEGLQLPLLHAHVEGFPFLSFSILFHPSPKLVRKAMHDAPVVRYWN
jgi:hypothetical protein